MPAKFFLTNTFLGDVTLTVSANGHLSISNGNSSIRPSETHSAMWLFDAHHVPLVSAAPDPDRPGGVTTHEQVRITLGGLLRLVDGVRDQLAAPELARLALADELHPQGAPKNDPIGDVLGWEARTDLETGIGATIDWLRGRPVAEGDVDRVQL